MPEGQTLFETLRQSAALLFEEPLIGYSLIAALFLVVVSLGSAWKRLDFLAIVRPAGLLKITLAVILSIGLLFVELQLETAQWLFAGISRLPLYLVVLAYGPSAGLLAAGLVAAFVTTDAVPGFSEAVLALELIVLGYLAISPSAWRFRWAAPINIFLAYSLAWLTGGVALHVWQHGSLMLPTLWLEHQPYLGGLALVAFLLMFVSPERYKAMFPQSRIRPKLVAVPADTATSDTATPDTATPDTDEPIFHDALLLEPDD